MTITKERSECNTALTKATQARTEIPKHDKAINPKLIKLLDIMKRNTPTDPPAVKVDDVCIPPIQLPTPLPTIDISLLVDKLVMLETQLAATKGNIDKTVSVAGDVISSQLSESTIQQPQPTLEITPEKRVILLSTPTAKPLPITIEPDVIEQLIKGKIKKPDAVVKQLKAANEKLGDIHDLLLIQMLMDLFGGGGKKVKIKKVRNKKVKIKKPKRVRKVRKWFKTKRTKAGKITTKKMPPVDKKPSKPTLDKTNKPTISDKPTHPSKPPITKTVKATTRLAGLAARSTQRLSSGAVGAVVSGVDTAITSYLVARDLGLTKAIDPYVDQTVDYARQQVKPALEATQQSVRQRSAIIPNKGFNATQSDTAANALRVMYKTPNTNADKLESLIIQQHQQKIIKKAKHDYIMTEYYKQTTSSNVNLISNINNNNINNHEPEPVVSPYQNELIR